jgi:hypothetical protein
MPESEWIEVEPVDELAIEASMDYCETCGKYTAGDDACVACGAEDGPENRSGNPALIRRVIGCTVRAGGRCCAGGGTRQNPLGSRVGTLGVPAALLLLFPLRWFAWRTER